MLTTEQQNTIAEKLRDMHLPAGLGDKENACSIAAINLALTGQLTDKIPNCMSRVIGRWIIETQDSMPDELRNSQRWKSLLPLAAGTGREKEKERLAIILDCMWGTVLPVLQPLANEQGFGTQWKQMTEERTAAAAGAAALAADAAAARCVGFVWRWGLRWASRAADAASRAALATKASRAALATDESSREAEAAARAALAKDAVDWAARTAERAAAAAARWAEAAAAGSDSWETFDPCGLLERLIRA